MPNYERLLGERFVSVRPSILKLLHGDGTAAIFLSHLIFWSQSDAAKKNDGWFFVTGSRLQEETCLSRVSQTRIRAKLKELGLLEERKGTVNNRVEYRVNFDVLAQRLGMAGCKASCNDGVESGCNSGVQTHRVDNGVDPESIHSDTSYPHGASSSSAKPNAQREKLHLDFPEKVDREKFVAYVEKWYPKRPDGLVARRDDIERLATKLGKHKRTDDPATIKQKVDDLRAFSKAVENIAIAVASGYTDPKYVPSFPKFAGLGFVNNGNPGYRQWIDWKPPVNK